MPRLELAGGRPRGRAAQSFMEVVKEDVKIVGVREDSAEDRVTPRKMIGCGHSWREQPIGNEDENRFIPEDITGHPMCEEKMCKTRIS